MFEFIRAHTRLFQFILVVLIFPSFVFFGVQGYSSFREGASKEVASVDGRGITQAEWDQAHQRNIERMRERSPNIDIQLLDTPRMRAETLDGLVRERVLLAAAEGQHLFPADDRLAQRFRTDPQYASMRNPDGSVNRDLLTAQGLSSEGFAQQLRLTMGMQQLLSSVGGSAAAPKAATAAAIAALLQKRDVQFQRFSAGEYAAKVTPSDADLEAYYKANEASLRLPETAQIEYVLFDVPTLAAGIEVSEAQLREYYDQNAPRFTAAEERRARHILINAAKDAPAAERSKAKARAEELLADLRKAPARFAELAKAHSQDPGSAAKGGDLDFFGRGAMVKPFEDAAFAMKAGEISNVVESDFGYHIIQLTATRGGEKKAFESVRAEIDGEVRRQLAQRKFAENAEGFQNMVYEQSDSLQPVIDKYKLKKLTATVGRTPAPGAAGALASAKLLDAVFKEDTVRNKRNTDAVDLGGSQFAAARVIQHSPARTPPLADIKDRVRNAVVQQQAAALARKAGQDRLAALKAAPQTELPNKASVARSQPQGLPGPVLDAILQTPADKLPAVLGVDLGAQGYVVAKVLKVLSSEADLGAGLIEGQLAPLYAQAETVALVEALKLRYKAALTPEAKAAAAAASAASAAR